MTPEMKIVPYKHSYNKEAPYVPYDVAIRFVEYAKSRGIDNFIQSVEKYKEIMFNKNSEEWIKRNENCWNIIKKMRVSGINCIEADGKFKGLPTVEELKLLQHMSTTMSQKYIKHVLKKMGYNFIMKYDFSK
jgi:hypothetical protein